MTELDLRSTKAEFEPQAFYEFVMSCPDLTTADWGACLGYEFSVACMRYARLLVW